MVCRDSEILLHGNVTWWLLLSIPYTGTTCNTQWSLWDSNWIFTPGLQSRQVKHTPPRSHQWNLLFKSWIPCTCRFQIHLCILACVMSREFTREAVRKFEPTQFPRIWRKCLLRNFIHSKIFNLSKYREVLMTYSLLITHAEMPNWTWHQLQERL